MLQLNKYLREVGIDENYWLFKNQMMQDMNQMKKVLLLQSIGI
jgi:hypothetical protein